MMKSETGSGCLNKIVAERQARTGAGTRPLPDVRGISYPPRRDFAAALRGRRVALIAECKAASPSEGELRADYDPAALARQYMSGGAAAISVLTEEQYFRGHLAHIAEVKKTCGLPVVRKDFLLDPYDLYESRVAGADAVLLIVAVLGETTATMLGAARQLGLDALVEVHNEEELAIALRSGAGIIGINNRNLKTMAIDLATTERLRPLVPAGTLVVTESGVLDGIDLQRLQRAGVDAALIGTALTKAARPAEKLLGLQRALGTQVKICGVTSPEQAYELGKRGVDLIGINFYQPSPRSVDRAAARDIAAAAREAGPAVAGLFVDEPYAQIVAAIDQVGFDWVQLHGAEPPELCRELSLPVIKAFTVRAAVDLNELERYAVAAYLFDAAGGPLPGGTGTTFAWELLRRVPRRIPLFLAGGLGPGNIAEAVAAVDPDVIDIASGVESAPGIKDMAKVEQLLMNLRARQ